MPVTFEDIKKANETIVTTGIERYDKKTQTTTIKQYAEVNQRIKAFRMVYPTGFIETEILKDEEIELEDGNKDRAIIMRATVGYTDPDYHRVILGTGTAREIESSSYINRTSYIPNCETSAAGRALGMAGFGIDTSVASYEEVKNAMSKQPEQSERKTNENGEPLINKLEWEHLKLMYPKEQIKEFYKEAGITRGMDMTLDFFTKKQAEYDTKFKEEHPEKQYY